MHRKEILLQENLEKTIDHLSQNQKVKSRVTSLAPYIVQIERRKKLRQLAKQSKKNLNQSSSRSFRIKDKSLTSLHKQTISRTRDVNPQSGTNKLIQHRPARDKRTKSLQKQRQFNYSKTLDNRAKVQPSSNNFFNDLYAKVKNKVQKQKPSRKKQYQTLDGPRSRSQQSGTINVKKIAYTNSIEMPSQAQSKKPAKKGNFRRNKFQYSSSCIENNPPLVQKQHILSQSKLQLDKKESNVSINKQMDKIALRQMMQHEQLRNKQFHRSIQKDTEKYFSYESYRPAKSKNDIEVILSTAKNPSLHKVSHSTADKPQVSPPVKNNATALAYDFSFPTQEEENYIKQIQNSQQQSVRQLGGQTVFIDHGLRQGVLEWQDGLEC